MINTMTQESLRVSNEGTAVPYILLPESQVAEVGQLLDQHGIRYQVDEYAVSLDGAPETTVIELGRGTDADAVQAILDGARD